MLKVKKSCIQYKNEKSNAVEFCPDCPLHKVENILKKMIS